MFKKSYLAAGLNLLMAAVAGPSLVSAEGDPLASPTPLPPERVTAPEIFGVNPKVVLSEGNQGETLPSDIILCLLDKSRLFQKQLTKRGDMNSSFYFTPDGTIIVYSASEQY